MLLAIAYLLLVIRENILCWVCAGISSGIYVWLFAAARLYMESALYLFYVGMAAYGWYSWQSGRRGGEAVRVAHWSWRRQAPTIALLAAAALLAGLTLDKLTNAAFPYVDSLTTLFGIWATYLVARKVYENWWYWLVIDLVSIIIYWQRDLQLTALLFVVYVGLIPVGMLQWRRSMAAAVSPGRQLP